MYFPLSNNARVGGGKVIDASGHRITDLLTAVLKFFPVEVVDKDPVVVMAISEQDK